MKITWSRVREGEASEHGVSDPHHGWVGRSPVGVYFVWAQARIRHEGTFYAGARVEGGRVERYGGSGDTAQRPLWIDSRSSWLCDEGTLRDAKYACQDDANRRIV